MMIEKERKVQLEIKHSFEQVILQMKEDMRKIKEEWERRLAEEDLEHQRSVVALQS